MSKKLVTLSLLAAGCCVLASCTENENAEETTSIDAVPAEVRAAIERHAPGATVKEVERETEHGRTLYSVEVVRDGKQMEFEVSPDGKSIKDEIEDHDDDGEDDDAGEEADDDGNEQEIAVSALPDAVTNAVMARHPGAKLTEAELCKSGDKTFYEVEVTAGGQSRELKVAPDGAIQADELDDDDGKDDDGDGDDGPGDDD